MPKLVRTGSLTWLWVCLYVLTGSSFGLAETLGGLEPDAKFGGTYRRALANNPATLDPAFVSDIYSRTVVTQTIQGPGPVRCAPQPYSCYCRVLGSFP